jgi:hypothetical protein
MIRRKPQNKELDRSRATGSVDFTGGLDPIYVEAHLGSPGGHLSPYLLWQPATVRVLHQYIRMYRKEVEENYEA